MHKLYHFIKNQAVNIFGLCGCLSTIIYALHVEHLLPLVGAMA